MMIHNLPRALHVAVDEGTIAYGKIMKAIDEAKHNSTTQKVKEQPRVGISSRSDMVMNRIGF